MTKRVFIILFYLVVLVGQGWAAYDPLGRGAGVRPLSLGGAYVGLADDGASLFINPAGPASDSRLDFFSMYSQSDTEMTFSLLGLSLPAVWDGSIGLGYRNQINSNVYISTAESSDFVEQDLAFNFAKRVNERLCWGANYRLIGQGFTRTISGYESANGSGSALDLGLKFQPSPWLGFGASILGQNGRIAYQGTSEATIDAKTTIGLALKRDKPNLTLLIDASRIPTEPVACLHVGLEWRLVKEFALRFGIDQAPKGGVEHYNHVTAGFGVTGGGVNFNYAFRKRDDPSQGIEHYFSLGYQGKPRPKPKAKAELKKMYFEDVPEDYWAREAISAVTSLGIMSWFNDGTFKPDRPIHRAEIVMLLVRAKDYDIPDLLVKVFEDVKPDYWAAPYIQSAYENELTQGYPDNTFRPRRPTSRAEAVVFAMRFSGQGLSEATETLYEDMAEYHWGINEILTAKQENIINYITTNHFVPDAELTRGELAYILYQLPSIKAKL